MLEIGTKAPAFTLPDKDGNLVSLSDFAGKKIRSLQIVLLRKLLVGGRGVLADADDHRVDLLEIFVRPGEGTSLTGASGGVVPGIEVQHDLLPASWARAGGWWASSLT